MYTPRHSKVIRGKGLVVRVVAVRRNQYPSAGKAHYDGRMVEVPRPRSELNYIAGFQFVKRDFLGKRPRAIVLSLTER